MQSVIFKEHNRYLFFMHKTQIIILKTRKYPYETVHGPKIYKQYIIKVDTRYLLKYLFWTKLIYVGCIKKKLKMLFCITSLTVTCLLYCWMHSLHFIKCHKKYKYNITKYPMVSLHSMWKFSHWYKIKLPWDRTSAYRPKILLLNVIVHNVCKYSNDVWKKK